MSSRLRIPVATYRLQFNKDFRFQDATEIINYLNRLGITDIYASPLLMARKNSSHGYDVTDPTRLNPELGTEKDFEILVKELKINNIGLLLDIVPNHMAASPENPLWCDVLTRGNTSPFAKFFDTKWLDFDELSNESPGYRRFFDIGDFVGVRIEEPQVFETTHSLIFALIAEEKITGVRLDHIDGLYDPYKYLSKLQERISPSMKVPDFYIIVEKILASNETIPMEWPVFGTTGYEFARMINSLFVDNDGSRRLYEIYARTINQEIVFHDSVFNSKKLIMNESFPKELKALGDYLAYLSRQVKNVHQISHEAAYQALTELTACLPVYRTYTRSLRVSSHARKYIKAAAQEAARHNPAIGTEIDFLEKVLLLDFPADITPDDKNKWLNFVMRWQQLTGAVMAKGYEDTALYNYNYLISLNEVGGDPGTGGISVREFHQWNKAREKRWPHTMNTTSTHDTKRSEDVRARINVISEIPDDWERHLRQWQEWNRPKKIDTGLLSVPEPNTEIFLYQTLIGTWPLQQSQRPAFVERLKAYMIKAVREAKVYTSWLEINNEYEESLLGFIDVILDDSTSDKFLGDFIEFQKKTAYFGALNSLSQILLKITSPGMPDFYQGTELWDFSLVDPDNRRPVDFQKRNQLLETIIEREAAGDSLLLPEILSSWQDGRIKLYVTYKTLNIRREYSELFQKGDYLPIKLSGNKQEHVCAFIRHYQGERAIIVSPRFFTKLVETDKLPIGEKVWGDTYISLPDNSPGKWFNIFTDKSIITNSIKNLLPLSEVLNNFPIAMLLGN